MNDQTTYNHKLTIQNLKLIFEHSEHSKLDYSENQDVVKAIDYIANCFNITPIQTCFVAAVFMLGGDDAEVGCEKLLSFFGFEMIDFFDFKEDFEVLLNRQILKLRRVNRASNLYNSAFCVNQKLLDAIFNNESINDALDKNDVSFIQFCSHVGRIVCNNQIKNNSIFELADRIVNQENKNSTLKEINELVENEINVEHRILLYLLVDDTTNNEATTSLVKILSEIYGRIDYLTVVNEFITSQTQLHEKGLIEVNSTGFVEDATINLTNKAKDLLLGRAAVLFKKKTTKHQLIKCESITEKELFFNEKQNSEIEFFKASIKNDNLLKLKTKLLESKIQKSIIAIFEGISGSGKTESCYQIAKELQYDLFVLDFTKMKSSYFSESQKLVKEAFAEYREVSKSNERPVILLINEADGLLQQRVSNSIRSNQTENEIQTILLEEFEKTDDIIILTTNLIDSIDSAFYRRFLFKIRFENPNKTVLKQIFKSKLTRLANEDLDRLSNYELTGGEVDNVVTKVLINEVVSLQESTIDDMLEFCKQEKIEKRRVPKLGFHN